MSRSNELERYVQRIRRGVLTALLALVLSGTPAYADLIIVSTYDSSITSDSQSATIQNTINQAIAVYQTRFADPITVQITFAEMNTGVGMSNTAVFPTTYAAYRAALVTDATTTNDATALAHL